VSNVFQDTEGAQAHYSERLARLGRIPAWVEKTRVPSREMSREELGMAKGTRYYACPMKLQKMHPGFDAALAAILERDPRGEIVLFEDPDKPLWHAQLSARFRRSMPGVSDRVVFRPYAARDEFLGVLRQADCVMDTFFFSGGVTTYNAFSIGVPVLTLPGELFRSRMTAGMYAQAGIEDAVARTPQDFVDRALRWAANPDERLALGRRITESRGELFETAGAVDLLGDWLDEEGRRGG
jgi:protein O-GlcNAc transferase